MTSGVEMKMTTYETFVQSDTNIGNNYDEEEAVAVGVETIDTTATTADTTNTEPTNTKVLPCSPKCDNVYDADAIRAEFLTYKSVLPKPDHLLQQQHSAEVLHDKIRRLDNSTIPMPRFLKLESDGGIKPHNALCCLLLDDFHHYQKTMRKESLLERLASHISKCCIWMVSVGRLYPQLHLPADVIRDQFYRVAHVLPTWTEAEHIGPTELRHKIRTLGLPIPNFFLDPEDPKQFPPHIALLVILQDGQDESRHLQNYFYRLAWFMFALVAFILRLVLEVIGGAGAIWGGSEVFHLRIKTDDYNNHELWRWISILVGVFCFFRFVTLNAPQQEDEGDILGPAGPWSLRTPARLRAVCEHPFHYFCRAQQPYTEAIGATMLRQKNRKQS